MRPTRIAASISLLNSQQGVPAADQAPLSVAARRSMIDLGYRAPSEDFANVAGPSATDVTATSSRPVSCQRDVEKTLSRWGASTIHKVMKPASRRREDRGFTARGVEATRSGAITMQQARRIGEGAE